MNDSWWAQDISDYYSDCLKRRLLQNLKPNTNPLPSDGIFGEPPP